MPIANDNTVIRIDHQNQGDVVFTPQSNDNFVLTVSETITAGAIHAENRRLTTEVKDKILRLQTRLQDWWKLHQDAIKSAHLGWDGRIFKFLVVQNQVEINEVLEGALIDLDLEIAHSKMIAPIEFHVMLLPDCDEACINTFIPPDKRSTVLPHANS